MSAIVRTIDGSFQALNLAQAKQHLRVEFDDDDNYINELIADVQELVENETWRILAPSTYQLYLDRFPFEKREIEIYRAPLTGLTSFEYYLNGVLTAVDANSYYVDTSTTPGRIVLKNGAAWPTNADIRPSTVVVTFTGGYATAADVPKGLVRAMRLLVAHFYENRQPSKEAPGIATVQIPLAYQWLVTPYKLAFF